MLLPAARPPRPPSASCEQRVRRNELVSRLKGGGSTQCPCLAGGERWQIPLRHHSICASLLVALVEHAQNC
eukprot:3100488-Pleurochrysis_carterae.AAC.3